MDPRDLTASKCADIEWAAQAGQRKATDGTVILKVCQRKLNAAERQVLIGAVKVG